MGLINFSTNNIGICTSSTDGTKTNILRDYMSFAIYSNMPGITRVQYIIRFQCDNYIVSMYTYLLNIYFNLPRRYLKYKMRCTRMRILEYFEL